MHEIEGRDWVRQYLGGLEAQIATFRSLETRVAALEGKWREAEARRRVGRPLWPQRRARAASRSACRASCGVVGHPEYPSAVPATA
jgi:hypothetical protein